MSTTSTSEIHSVAPATRREDLLVVAAATWMIIGLFLDGYAHQHLIDGEESFWTPYHAVFYGGFAASAFTIYRMAMARVRSESSFWQWLPTGYPSAVAGLAVFAAGGIGDAMWHSVFGVEVGIDALLSPTHILLFGGALMVVTAPLRSRWRQPDGDGSWGDLSPAITSMTLAVSLVGFFTTYMWGPGFAGETRIHYDAATGAGEEAVIIGVATAVIPTAILCTGLGLLARRWRLPAGTAAVVLVVPNTLVIATFDYDGNGVTAGFVAALAAEVVLATVRAPWWRVAQRALVVVPIVLWSTVFALRAVSDSMVWEAELWTGTIFMCGITGAAVALLLDPYQLSDRAARR